MRLGALPLEDPSNHNGAVSDCISTAQSTIAEWHQSHSQCPVSFTANVLKTSAITGAKGRYRCTVSPLRFR